MIDAVGIYIPASEFPFYLEPANGETILWVNELRKRTGSFIRINRGGMFVQVSLPKILRGDNVINVDRNDIQEAFSMLSAGLGVDLSQSILYRVEIGATFSVSRSPILYMREWGVLSRSIKNIYNNGETVLFLNGAWEMIGYDKNAEQRSRNRSSSIASNAFRIEYRRKKSLKKLFDKKRIGILDLSTKEVYNHLVKQWAIKYFEIPKILNHHVRIPFTSPAKMQEAFAAYGLQQYGIDCAYSLLQDARKRGCVDNNAMSRFKKRLDKLHCSPHGDGHALHQEIDALVVEKATELDIKLV